jgi:hypothetical protein
LVKKTKQVNREREREKNKYAHDFEKEKGGERQRESVQALVVMATVTAQRAGGRGDGAL